MFKTHTENEQHNLVQSLKGTTTASIDFSLIIDHYMGKSHWKTTLFRIDVDVTIINTCESFKTHFCAYRLERSRNK